jgi:cation diffusion facilitator CzcD-associated flavoprotein CzcO
MVFGVVRGRGHYRVAVIGAGFAGLGTAIKLMQAGIDDFVVLERSGDLGGTWRDNTYPGCVCDVPSHLYSFSFAPNPDWTCTFSPQPEIWDYLRRCAEQAGILPEVRFDSPVTSMSFREEDSSWEIETPTGTMEADLVVAAVGPLSEPLIPQVRGLDSFEGPAFHSARWNHSFDPRDKRVAVVGTGASAIQIVPRLQPLTSKLVVFQRTPPWVLPRRDRRIGQRERWVYRHVPLIQRAIRTGIYWGRETLVLGFTRHRRLMQMAERLGLAQLRRQVPDPELRAKLTPRFTIGCKRILLANDYYPALTKDNVELVAAAVEEVGPDSVTASDGSRHEVDAIVFATGFHVTDFPAAAHIFGRGGSTLEKTWSASGMQAYKGITVNGFPNLFLVTGPNTGLGHSSMVFMIESEIAYVIDCLRYMDEQGVAAVEVRPEAQQSFNTELAGRLDDTVWNSGGCHSWYLDANGRNTTLWPGFSFEFRRRTRRFDQDAYVVTPRVRCPGWVPAEGPAEARRSDGPLCGTRSR